MSICPSPPSPRGAPLIGSIREIQRDNVAAFMTAFRDHGDVVRFKGPLKIDLVVHPDQVQRVLQTEHRNYPRPFKVQGCLQTIVGTGLVAAEGPFWRRSRRLAQPAFHQQVLRQFTDTFVQGTAELIDSWERRQDMDRPIDVTSAMMSLSLANLARALFRTDWSDEFPQIERAVGEALRFTHRRMTSPIDPYRIPGRRRARFEEALRTIDGVLVPLVEERRRNGGSGDLVGMLVDAVDAETGQGWTDAQIRDEVSGFFVAGHETVSSALSWTWYLLSKHPEIWRRVRAEALAVLGDRTPTADDLSWLMYTTMVLKEAMRMYPPIFVYMRCAARDDVVGGFSIPKGRWVVICPYVTHRHPDFWENPDAFDPERFTAENSAGRHRTAYLPFGAGPRKCIGSDFAMVQMPLVVAMLARRFRLDLVDGSKVVPEPAISLRPRDPMLMRLRSAEELW